MNSSSGRCGDVKSELCGTTGGRPIGLPHRVVPSIEYAEVTGGALTAQVWHGPLRRRRTSHGCSPLPWILAECIGCAESELLVTRHACRACGSAEHGRPVLVASPAHPHGAQISISYARDTDRYVLALSTADIGVDTADALTPDICARLRRTLTEPDRLFVDAAPAAVQPDLVLKAWVAREAYLKAKGVGLTAGWRQLSVLTPRASGRKRVSEMWMVHDISFDFQPDSSCTVIALRDS